MKKLFKTLIVTLCSALCLAFVACSTPGAPEYDTANPKYIAGIENNIKSELEAFVTEYADRTTFKSGEQLAAAYLADRLEEFGYAPTVQEFTVDENNVKGLNSRNVVAKLECGAENAKNVVLGAYYDNRYSEAYSNAATIKSESALAGGSGVASLLAVAQYLIKNHGEGNRLGYDVTIVFFGASYLYTDGANAFLRNGMTADERKNTVLMVEMQRLGVDYVYAYSDARETKREGFFDAVARDNGLAIYKQTLKSPAITEVSAATGVTYYQWAHSGLFSVFAEADIPTLNLIGGNWETMNLGDAESAEHENIAYTENDTLKVLARYYPDYASKMATAATLVIRSLESADFLSVMTYDREHYPDTDILTNGWIWYLIAVGALAIAFAIVFAVNARLAKKYKPEPKPIPPRVKMAVFGMDYEDKSAADIFIELRKQNEEIFPGIPNNDADKMRTGTGAVPPAFGGNASPAHGNEPAESDIKPNSDSDSNAPVDPFINAPVENNEPKVESAPEVESSTVEPAHAENIETEVENGAEVESTEQAEKSEKADKNSAGESASEEAPKKQTKRASTKKAEPKIEIVSPQKKRATVSAKKSVGAKKSTAAGEKKPVKKDSDDTEEN